MSLEMSYVHDISLGQKVESKKYFNENTYFAFIFKFHWNTVEIILQRSKYVK